MTNRLCRCEKLSLRSMNEENGGNINIKKTKILFINVVISLEFVINYN